MDYWEEDLRTLIKRDRNHPSVFIWSIGNEVLRQTNKKDSTYGVSMLREMVNFVHHLEPSREVTCALFPSRYNAIRYYDEEYAQAKPHQMAYHMDVMSVNYQSKFFQRDHELYPQLIFLLSEVATGVLGYKYFEYDHSYACGQFYWGGTEYIGESFGWPSKGWINGLIDLCNNLNPIGISVKSFYNDTPMVHIAVLDQDKLNSKIWNDVRLSSKPLYSHWNWNGKDSVMLQTFTNCDSVELITNGKSQGIKSIVGKEKPELFWHIKYEPGMIEAHGIKNGKVITKHELQTAGEACRIIMEADRDTIDANGLDLSYITLKVVDKEGNIVPSATNRINFKVTGEGSNAGVGNGDIMSNELWQTDSRSVYYGQCQLIVRSSAVEGKIRIKASSQSLIPASLIITTLK